MSIENHYAESGIINVFFLGLVFQVKGPKNKALFSERYGYEKPIIKVFGFRVFIQKEMAL